jgi:hypothetical protein
MTHPDLKISPHDVTIESGLNSDPQSIGPFSAISAHDLESIGIVHLQRTRVGSAVIAGLDVDRDSLILIANKLRQIGITAHFIKDL